MYIVIKEETKMGTEYTSLKDENGKTMKFKNLGEAEDRLRSAIEGNGNASFILMG